MSENEKRISVRGEEFQGKIHLKVKIEDAHEDFYNFSCEIKDDVGKPINLSKEGLILIMAQCLKGLKGELASDYFWSNNELRR